MQLTIHHNPIPKQRPRYSTFRGKPRVYDAQKSQAKVLKLSLQSQMRLKGYLKAQHELIHIDLINHMAIPHSWSQKRLKEENGKFVGTKPDIDNLNKWTLDLLNGIAYEDDRQVVSLFSQKVYCVKPRTEIQITKIGLAMINEHAKTVQGISNIADLEYMIKKANRLGMAGRQISRTFSEEDAEGVHVYFEVQGLRNHNDEN